MFSEQMLLNAGVLIVAAKTGGADLTTGIVGFVFNVMLIVRAPLQLFQAIQTSILPHLAGLEARESADEFHKAIRTTIDGHRRLRLAVALGLLLIGPAVMTALLGDKGGSRTAVSGWRWSGSGWACTSSRGRSTRPRWRAAVRRRPRSAWLLSAAVFVAFVATGSGTGECGGHARRGRLLRSATAVLCALLWLLYRRGPATSSQLTPSAEAA